MHLNEWYLIRAYTIMETSVPMPFDCGMICNKKCCNGSADDGMLLFPGEEKFFENDDNFIINDSPLGKTLICNGFCDRKKRPLSCRIFPMFPYVLKSENGFKISVLKDVRALDYCPLNETDVSPLFKRNIRLATRNLLRDADCAAFLLNLTSAFTDVGKF